MKRNQFIAVLVLGVVIFSAPLAATSDWEEPAVDGVLGISPVLANSAFAVWVPLDPDASIGGFRWYNNDSNSGFSEVLAVAGEYGAPELLSEATLIAEHVCGVEQGWSEWVFSQPIASGSSGLYLLLRLEEGAEYEGLGLNGGVGVGYFAGTEENNCWISGDGIGWDPLDSSFQMAVLPVQNTQKSGEVLRLTPPENEGHPKGSVVIDRPGLVKSRLASSGVSASPNPFNPNTTIKFELPERNPVKLSIFDIRGMLVRTLVNDKLEAGPHVFPWNGRDNNGRVLASGRYIVFLEAGRMRMTTSVVLVK